MRQSAKRFSRSPSASDTTVSGPDQMHASSIGPLRAYSDNSLCLFCEQVYCTDQGRGACCEAASALDA